MQKAIYDKNNTFDEVFQQLAIQNAEAKPEYYEQNSE